MRKQKMTPGPWTLESGTGGEMNSVRTSAGKYIYASEGNARAIAALPDLVHALEKIRDGDLNDIAHQVAAAALKKAGLE